MGKGKKGINVLEMRSQKPELNNFNGSCCILLRPLQIINKKHPKIEERKSRKLQTTYNPNKANTFFQFFSFLFFALFFFSIHFFPKGIAKRRSKTNFKFQLFCKLCAMKQGIFFFIIQDYTSLYQTAIIR